MTIAFLGHRHIDMTDKLKNLLLKIIKQQITENKATEFLFGSKSMFNDLCYKTVTYLQQSYPYIKRIYVRAEYEYINSFYTKYLNTLYESTYFPEKVHSAGQKSYVKRNEIIIDKSDVLIAYYNNSYKPSVDYKQSYSSGTKIAVNYAHKKKKPVINVYELLKFNEL